MHIISLDKLPLDTEGRILKLNCIGDIRRRLLDLGLVKNTSITPIFRSPLGDPTAYEVRCTIIAIRKEDARQIDVET